jgi:hypothetical protein
MMSRRKNQADPVVQDQPPTEPELETQSETQHQPGTNGTANGNGDGRNQPVTVVRLKNIRAAVWRNYSHDGLSYFTVSLSRLYKDGDGWRSSGSLGRDDLLLAAKALDQAHTWITNETQSTDVPF